MSAADPSPVSPPITVLVVLLLTVGAASAMFIVLVWRATSHRRWVALAEWARERGLRFDPRPAPRPGPAARRDPRDRAPGPHLPNRPPDVARRGPDRNRRP